MGSVEAEYRLFVKLEKPVVNISAFWILHTAMRQTSRHTGLRSD